MTEKQEFEESVGSILFKLFLMWIGGVIFFGIPSLLFVYGLIRMVFKYGFGVELWNPFG